MHDVTGPGGVPPRAADQTTPRRSRQGSWGSVDTPGESPFDSLHHHLIENVEKMREFTFSSVENVQRSAGAAKENIGQLTLNTVESSQSFVEKVPVTQSRHTPNPPHGGGETQRARPRTRGRVTPWVRYAITHRVCSTFTA